ncbi:MAG: sugar phosphate isomerase/epimerase [Caldilineaceae bacterium]|nr:sugar phosphate isomerase/epimerase [Caldilineaceae bacterium]
MSSIALQLYSIRDIAAADLPGTLARLAEIGYDGVEFAGYYDVDPAEIRRTLDAQNLGVAGAHVGFQLLEDDLDRQIELAQAVGCPAIGCPGLWNVEYNLATFERMAALFNHAGARCQDEGLGFFYHIHGFEFVDVDGKRTGMDVLLEQMDPQLVTLEPDTHWVARAGVDPVAFVRENAARCSRLHLKDAADKNDWNDTEVGAGVIDMAGVVAAAPNAEWWVVEQEGFDRPPMESVAMSLENLRKLQG